jgi:hypothetical protein
MDAVMALWFCEIVAREVLTQAGGVSQFLPNQFASRNDVDSRYVVSLDELATAQTVGRL